MNGYLKHIQEKLQQDSGLTEADRKSLLEIIAGAALKTKIIDRQKHELEIEAALERVRSVAMGMKKPAGMLDICKTIARQLELLRVKEIRNVQTAVFYAEKETYFNYEFYTRHDKQLITEVKYNDHNVSREFARRMLGGSNQVWMYGFKGEEIREWLNHQRTTNVFIDSYLENADTLNYYWYSLGPVAIGISTYVPLQENEIELFKRFRNVFELVYRRYLDIEKAEAQAREAKVEAALEKVRSRSLAMHSSNELSEVVAVVFERLQELNFFMEGGAAIIITFMEGSKDYIQWITDYGQTYAKPFRIPYTDHSMSADLFNAKENGEDFFSRLYPFEEKNEFFHFLFTYSDYKYLPDIIKKTLIESRNFGSSVALGNKSAILIPATNGKLISGDEKDILKRFAGVFDQAYTRFLDLQKAEAQAREAQIQLALERVRARALSMQQSTDLLAVAEVLWEQLKSLGQPELESSLIHLYNDDPQRDTFDNLYAFYTQGRPSEELIFGKTEISKTATEWAREAIAMYKSPQTEYTIVSRGGKLKEWYHYLAKIAKPVVDYDENGQLIIPEVLYYHFSNFSGGSLLMISSKEPAPEACDLHKRAATEFDLAYTRFLDLKKAETQAREAQIEAALERVRAKAMAMQKSEDLSNAIAIVFEELDKLNLGLLRCGISIINKEKRTTNIWSTTKTEKGNIVQVSGDESMDIHPLLQGAYHAWLKLEDFSYLLKGEDIYRFYNTLAATNFQLPGSPGEMQSRQQYMYVAHFPVGGLYAFSETEFPEAEKNIIRRFGDVFNLTYTRFNDLQIAEANTKEAVKQAALDRIRADIASMRSPSDLEKITPLIWNELKVLNIPFTRCGVYIMDKQQQFVHTFLSTPEGKAIAAFHIPFHTPGKIEDIITHWQQQKEYIDHWDESDYTRFADELVKLEAIGSPAEYLQSIPQGGLYLHCLPFLQGMLYVANTTALKEDDLNLIQSVTGAFSTAYARYEDFNKLEAAKQQVEKTLTDLKQAQQQLIQNEKMASLGELTAGIAHEIQNPLNFVNNFSEVNKDLLAEMNEEIEKGNLAEAKAIAKDVIDNEEKINHHGKRADAIVKGMLQHSGTSSGQKQSTDLNALCDEYLRLAYHGLRAKDKTFNATFKTGFDTALPKINVVPQDIGRVVLNLINNAFYAVNEKQKQLAKHLPGFKNPADLSSYEPTVIVSTKREKDKAMIKVADNGNGIPQNIVDKIFQPFFTTKPTGQGTGLGLSLSYDIIKAHGGELRAESTDGEGSQFVISLTL